MSDIWRLDDPASADHDPNRHAASAISTVPLNRVLATPARNHRILLADDDQDILLGATLRLRAAGFETMAVEDGDRAVSVALQERPDAIVLDIRMPRKDGLSALSELRHQISTRDIPVVMLSASVVDEKKSLDAGARFFLRKPYRGDDLVAAITTALTANTPPKHE